MIVPFDEVEGFSIHTVVFATVLLSIVMLIVMWFKYKPKRGYLYLPFTYIINAILFNIFLFCGLLTIEAAELWSGLVRMHGIILLMTLLWLQVKRVN